jgi:hypothetical protein
MSRLSPQYIHYIHSDTWRARAAKKKRQVGARFADGEPRCENCGVKKQWPHIWLEVNHLHYLTLGKERMGDLNVLCAGPASNHCHEKADEERRARNADTGWPGWSVLKEKKRPWWRFW